jgi:hypothetical protein
VRPNGRWDIYFNEVLRDLGAPILSAPPNTVSIDKAFWELNIQPPHATAEPWGAGVPLEADLYDLAEELREGDANAASCELPRKQTRIEIVVHHRGLDPMVGANVRVTLLWWADPATKNAAKWDDVTTWAPAMNNVAWTDAVNEVLNNADGKTTKALGPGWRFGLGTNNTQTRRLTLAGQTLDPTHSGIATFDLDLSSRKRHSVVLLVAIIRAGSSPGSDIALTANTLPELVLTSSNVAVRSIHIV